MVFRDRHDAEYIIDRRLRITDRLHHIVRLFDPSDRYVVLPRNWAEKFAPINPLDGQPWHPTWFRNYLGELTCKRTSGPHSLLGRYVISETDYSEMMKYYRSPEGDAFAAEHGYPKLAYHREREPDKHQLFGCLTRASLELGVRTDIVGLLLASQFADQLDEGVRSEVATNTTVKFAGPAAYSVVRCGERTESGTAQTQKAPSPGRLQLLARSRARTRRLYHTCPTWSW